MHRFFCGSIKIKNTSTIELTNPQEIHHLKDVLRLKKNDQVVVFNASGEEAAGTILSTSNHAIMIRIDYLKPSAAQKHTRIILACAIPKKAKFETIIEKATELGVDEIIPLMTERTIVFLKGEQALKKSARYQTISANAAKQSGRRSIPVIHPPTKFKDALKLLDDTYTGFIPNLSLKNRNILEEIKTRSPSPKMIFFIGPEGDFTKEEITQAVEKGVIPVSLGPNVLKVDTAAISVVAMANLLFNHE